MDLWGRCRSCRRWFPCPLRAQGDDGWHCPVCGSEPVMIENRTVSPAAALVRLVRPLRSGSLDQAAPSST